MISFGRAILGLVLCVTALGAASSTGAPDPVLADRVGVRIAKLWNVEQEKIELEWGRANGRLAVSVTDSIALQGNGSDGFFTVVIRQPTGRASTVRLRAGVWDSVWVAARALDAGRSIADGDLDAQPCLSWGAPATEPGLAPRVGWILRRPIPAGERVGWPAAVEPPLVRAGEAIRMTWNHGGVTVSMEGIALNDAREGEIVRARVVDRTGPLLGTVTGQGCAVLQRGGD